MMIEIKQKTNQGRTKDGNYFTKNIVYKQVLDFKEFKTRIIPNFLQKDNKSVDYE